MIAISYFSVNVLLSSSYVDTFSVKSGTWYRQFLYTLAWRRCEGQIALVSNLNAPSSNMKQHSIHTKIAYLVTPHSI